MDRVRSDRPQSLQPYGDASAVRPDADRRRACAKEPVEPERIADGERRDLRPRDGGVVRHWIHERHPLAAHGHAPSVRPAAGRWRLHILYRRRRKRHVGVRRALRSRVAKVDPDRKPDDGPRGPHRDAPALGEGAGRWGTGWGHAACERRDLRSGDRPVDPDRHNGLRPRSADGDAVAFRAGTGCRRT